MIEFQNSYAGVILPVHAQPGARKNGITGIHAGRLKIAVTQAPEKGKANEAIIKVLSDLLNLKRSQISLLSGDTSQHKRFLIIGGDQAALEQQISALLKGS